MTIFAEKLATLVDTVRASAFEADDAIVEALRNGAGRLSVAIGSRGSAVMAQYFARCRSTLGLGGTIVYTPMESVVSQRDLDGADVWIFSAGADNPDTAAALSAVLGSSAASITLVTVNAEGASAWAAASEDRATAIVIPVAERKDGFLATHSLVAMATAVLAAADTVGTRRRPDIVIGRLAAEVGRIVSDGNVAALNFRPATLSSCFMTHSVERWRR